MATIITVSPSVKIITKKGRMINSAYCTRLNPPSRVRVIYVVVQTDDSFRIQHFPFAVHRY